MAYGLYLKLDQLVWFASDYSSENKLTGTIYTDEALSTAKNLTGYTITIRMFKRGMQSDHFNKAASIVTAASGTWSYAVAQNEIPASGVYLVKAELSKSGVIESTINNVEIFIKRGPSA